MSQQQIFRVFNPNGKDVEFSGEKLIEDKSSEIGKIEVYKTTSGKWVVSQTPIGMREAPDKTRVVVLEQPVSFLEIFGYSKAAKKIAESLELSVTDWVD